MRQILSRNAVRSLFAVVVAVLLASSLAQRYLGHVLAGPDLDFYDYYFAAQMVREAPRAPLYEGATEGNPQLKSAPEDSRIAGHARAAGFGETELYLYPPLLADALLPMTRVPAHLAAMLWRVLNLGLVLVCVAMLARMLGIWLRSSEFLMFAVLGYAFWPVHEAVSLGQVSVVMLALVTGAVVAYRRGWMFWSAALLAVATAVKITPLAVVPLFLLWRERRWLGWYAASLLALFGAMLLVNGPGNLRAFVQVTAAMSGAVPAMQNKGVGALVAWVYYGRLFTLQSVHAVLDAPPNRAVTLLSKAASVVVYAVCLGLVWRRRGEMLGVGVAEMARGQTADSSACTPAGKDRPPGTPPSLRNDNQRGGRSDRPEGSGSASGMRGSFTAFRMTTSEKANYSQAEMASGKTADSSASLRNDKPKSMGNDRDSGGTWVEAAVGERTAVLAVFVLVTAIISPVSWRHGYTVALIPLALLWVRALRDGATQLRAGLLALATVAMGSLVGDLVAQAPLPQPVKIACAGVWVLSALLLCLEFLWQPLAPVLGGHTSGRS